MACLTLLSSAIPAAADDDLPHNIRVIVEYIEVPHELVTELMRSEHADSGPTLHARTRALVKQKKARIMETSIVTSRSGQKATAESIMEYIYPVEDYAGDGLEGSRLPKDGNMDGTGDFKTPLRPSFGKYFQTRNVGVTLEIEPTSAEKGLMIDLQFAPQIIEFLRLETLLEYKDQWGEAPMKTPVFGTLRCSTSSTLQDGKFGFVGLLTPDDATGGRDTTRKIMLFVRADIVPINP